MKKICAMFLSCMLLIVGGLAMIACDNSESVKATRAFSNEAKYVLSETANPDGVTFTSNETYTVSNKLTTFARSYEAYVMLPDSTAVSANRIVMGNWAKNSFNGTDIAITSGAPRFHSAYYDESSASYKYVDVRFTTAGRTNVNAGVGTLVHDDITSEFINNGTLKLKPGQWIHIVITYDVDNERMNLYLNGKLTSHYEGFRPEGNEGNIINDLSNYKMKIGGDARNGNTSFFLGSMKMAATYSDVRTAEEIASDYQRIVSGEMFGSDNDGMLFGYDLTKGYPDLAKDKSEFGNDLIVSVAAQPGYKNSSNIVGGVTVNSGDALKLPSGTITAQPKTYEAVFRIKANTTSRIGTIFGNYGGTLSGNRSALNFEVRTYGIPALYLQNDSASTGGSNFGFGTEPKSGGNNYLPRGERKMVQLGNDFVEARGTNSPAAKTDHVEVATGNWVHMVMLHDPDNKTIKLYLDNILVSEITGVESANGNNYKFMPNGDFFIGGDGRADTGLFNGEIRSIAIYSDLRTEEEIYQNYLRKPGDAFKQDANLMCAYDFTRTPSEMYKDMSGRGKDLIVSEDMKNKYSSDNDGQGYDGDGMIFHYDEYVTMQKKLSALPKTIEANVLIPVSTALGTAYNVVSNMPDIYPYKDNYKQAYHVTPAFISFQVSGTGLRFYYVPADDTDSNREVYDIEVEADVRTGSWRHVALVIDDEQEAIIFYVDGQEVGRNTDAYMPLTTDIFQKNLRIGGNYRTVNAEYFRGAIRHVSIFSDVRTPAELKKDATGIATNEQGLLVSYDLNVNEYGIIQDRSANDVDALYENVWKDEGLNLDMDEYAYSFAIVGDTQMLNCKFTSRHKGIYDWIVQEWDNKKIEHVFALGDITETNEASEWEAAKSASEILREQNKPHSFILGNHDSNSTFNQYFGGDEKYTSQFEGFYRNVNGAVNYTNSYRRIEVGGTKYLLIGMDYGMPDEVLTWAGKLCDQYSDHKVIVYTHSYISRDGTRQSVGEYADPNQRNQTLNCGDEAWDKFVKKHGNIFMVLCGHQDWDSIYALQDKGDHGNTVYQFLIDPQTVDTYSDGSGIVALFYFSKDGKKLAVEYVSTTRALLGVENCYFRGDNQFIIDLDTEKEYCAHDKAKHEVAKAIKERGNCSTPAEYYYSCECGKVFEGATFFGSDLGNHKYVDWKYNNDATCTSNGTETAKCEFCDKTKTRDRASGMLEHSFNDEHACHDRNCNECGQKISATSTHEWNDGVIIQEATETVPGKKVFTCVDCNETKTEVVEYVAPSNPEEPPTVDKDESSEDGGCGSESIEIVLMAVATLIAAAFVLKK